MSDTQEHRCSVEHIRTMVLVGGMTQRDKRLVVTATCPLCNGPYVYAVKEYTNDTASVSVEDILALTKAACAEYGAALARKAADG